MAFQWNWQKKANTSMNGILEPGMKSWWQAVCCWPPPPVVCRGRPVQPLGSPLPLWDLPPTPLQLPPTPLFNKLPPSSSSCPLNSHSSCLSAVLRITIWASVPLNWGTAFDPNRPKVFDKKFPKPLSKVNSRSGYFIIWTSTNLK